MNVYKEIHEKNRYAVKFRDDTGRRRTKRFLTRELAMARRLAPPRYV